MKIRRTSALAVCSLVALIPLASFGENRLVAAADALAEVLVPPQEFDTHVEIHRLPQLALSLSEDFIPPPTLKEETYFNTQGLVLGSSAVVQRFIERGELPIRVKGAAEEDGVRHLRNRLEVLREKNSAIFTIRVRAATREEAHDIAAGIAEAYRELRSREFYAEAKEQLAILDQEIRSQEDLVEEKRKLYHTICKAMGFFIPGTLAPAGVDAAIRDHLATLEAEKGREAAVDFGLQSVDFCEALNDLQSARAIEQELKEQHARGRIAIKLPVRPITVHGHD